ncbi:ribokinase-like isoform X2 [Diospyros lotus]|uniref:ribokinase-like isoform X2 n=1 Tax=Diospyros lotus TaxID=55363 RepID=UPI0022544194|nr:ribokinase-like isoform X2 [Diospyros lotus]
MASPPTNITRKASPDNDEDEFTPSSLPPLPQSHLVVGCGFLTLDFLAIVPSFPQPDDKIRSTSSKVQGGGNIGNASTCAARLGLKPKLISKVADDPQGRDILEELESDGVDTSLVVVSKGKSPTTYVIVDNQMKTRTCIYTPGFPPMKPDELSNSSLLSALSGARLVYFDGKLHKTALVVAQEAHRMGIPILVDAERKRKGLDILLNLSTYVVCAAKFPQEWTESPSVPSALVSMLVRLPNVNFVIVTFGEDGCLMLERSATVNDQSEGMDADSLLKSLEQRKDKTTARPTCISSTVTRMRVEGVGEVSGRFFLGTAENIPASEVIDTTGAGDAFVGAVLYAICTGMPQEKMLRFAAQVAAACCRALGARTGLPGSTDPRLAPYLL